MAPKGKPGSAQSADNTADAPGIQSADSACDTIRSVMDEHAMTLPERHNYLVAIHTASTTPVVDAPYMLNTDFVPVPPREETHQGGDIRRFIIDNDFVAQTADQATAFNGDFLSWSFRMDEPLMHVNVEGAIRNAYTQ
jgi:hypothetical protein